MAADPRRVKELFAAALGLTDLAARRAFLERECADDAELRDRLDVLLHAHDQPQPALDQPLADVGTPPGEPTSLPGHAADEQLGTVLADKYKLLERIGEGGMGSVWMAQQYEPVKRLVAVKLIKAGADSRTILARFEAERQALALMDHPNIARVLDAGTTATGRPFFVMELVKGVPITKFCDARKLTPRQRLELFVPICQAIQHAHQKGVIHRDLKPSNVLVALYDDRPVPKVIDFGLVKATGPQLTEESLHTGFGAIVGTPQYMSPEQATLNNLDIDTRSDIYSLGVLLYELLAGSPPFDRKELAAAGMLEILRVIREDEPPTPSARLSSAEALPRLAAQRSTEPAKLTRLLRGEIDWIVMKALEKERSRRYETANGLALDLQRFLADEPVQAGPPGATYRLRKFVKRNKGRVLAATLVLLALVAGLVGTTMGLVQAEAARQAEAERAEGERLAKLDAEAAAAAAGRAKQEAEKSAAAERAAKQSAVAAAEAAKAAAAAEKVANEQAQRRLQQIEKGNEILVSVFQNLDPRAEEKEGLSLRVLLGKRLGAAVKQLEGEAVGDALTVARLQGFLAVSLMALGHYEQAEAALTKAWRTNEALLGADHPIALLSKGNLATLYEHQGKFVEAEQLDTEVLAVRTATLGPDHPDTLICKGNLALVYQEQGKYDQAEKLYKELLATQTRLHGADYPDTAVTRHNLAALYSGQGKYAQAEVLYNEALAMALARHGADHPDTLHTKANLATLYSEQARYAQAEALDKEVLAARSVKLGSDHHDTLQSKHSLATLYRSLGRYAQAETLLQDVLAGFARTLRSEHPSALVAKHSLAMVYEAQQHFARAEKLLQEVHAAQTARLGADHPQTLASKHDLAVLYRSLGKVRQAETLSTQTLKAQIARLGANHPETLATKLNLAGVYQDQGKFVQARALYDDVLKRFTTTLPAAHPKALTARNNFAHLLNAQGKYAHAEQLYQQVVEATTKALGAEHPHTLSTKNGLAVARHHLGKHAQAEALYREVLEVGTTLFGDDHPTIITAKNNLADLCRILGKHGQAETLFKEVVASATANLGADHPSTLTTKHNLAALYASQRKHEQAERLYQEVLKGQTAKLGAEHPLTLAVMNNLAALYWKMKRFDRSVPLLVDAVKGRTQVLGPAHPDTLLTVANLGVNYRDAGRMADGIRCLEDALAGVRSYPGPLPTKLAWIQGELAATYDRAKQFAKSETLYRDFVQRGRRQFGKEDFRTANLLAVLGQNLLVQHKHGEAEQTLRECLAIRDNKLPDVWATFNTKSMLGAALLGQKKHTEAEPLLLAGYEGLKQRQATIPLQAKRRLPEAVQRLVQLYQATGNQDALARWRLEQERLIGKVIGPVHEVGTGLELKGKLDAQTRALVYQVKLVAGKAYVIDLVSPDPKALDPFLVLSDAAGNWLAVDDDSGGGLNARITFRAERDGTYRIQATSFNTGSGAFTLTVRAQPLSPKKATD